MKFFVSWFLVGAAALALLFGGLVSSRAPRAREDKTPQVVAVLPIYKPVAPQAPAQSEDVADEAFTVTVYNAKADAYMRMPLDEYLYGVVLAEMPSDFGDEALKAQAVAARTLVMYKLSRGCPADHADAPVCTSSGHCMAYISPEDYVSLSGGGTGFLARVKDAVDSTSGQIMTYGGEPIMAAFHASSYEYTESSEAYWSSPYPYLVPVETPEHLYPDECKNLSTEKKFSYFELYDAITSKYPDAALTVSAASKGASLERASNGRVASLSFGGVTLTGAQAKKIFSLRSDDFTVEAAKDGVIFRVRGSGHGVGMSQYGAKIYDLLGKDHEFILGHYYTGAVLSKI